MSNENNNDMNTASNDAARPMARPIKSRWFGIVWAIPFAALIIVVFLGIRAFAHRGIDAVVTFTSADGVSVGDTKVIYQGLVAGKVSKIDINKDLKRVDVTLRLDPRAKPAMNSNTVFWLIGEKPDLSDISSVKAALTGLTIGIAPGFGGQPTNHFDGLSAPPAIMPGAQGTQYELTCDRLDGARTGSPLYFRGQEIGKVIGVNRNEVEFKLDVFVNAPFDKLIRSETKFWVASPIKVDLSGSGIKADVAHVGAVLTGGVEVDDDDSTKQQSPPNSVYRLSADREEAEAGPAGPAVTYVMNFVNPGGDLPVGAPIRLMGFKVGNVTSVSLNVDEQTGGLTTSVLASLYPSRLKLAMPAAASGGDAWRTSTDAFLSKLVARGFRARLTQKPALIGGLVITLDQTKSPTKLALKSGSPSEIPTIDAGSGIDDLTGEMTHILTKVDSIPIEEIGQNVHNITAHLSTLISSPEVTDSLKHLDSTLAQADEMMTEVKPQIGPLVAKLNQAAGEIKEAAASANAMLGGEGASQDASIPAAIQQLSDTARSIKALADYLGRHPEALVKGKGKDAK